MDELKVKLFLKVPAEMCCYQCEEDYKFRQCVKMFITSTQLQAEHSDLVIWKCKKCGKSKVEKLDPGDGGRFWFEANKMNMVWVGH